MPTTDESIESLDARLAALRREITRLEAARWALATPRRAVHPHDQRLDKPGANPTAWPSGTCSVGAGQGQPSRVRSKEAARPTAVSADHIQSLLATNRGLSSEPGRRRDGGGSQPGIGRASRAGGAGRMRRSGARRSTRWHTITDDDRIATRAGELAALRQSGRAAAKQRAFGARAEASAQRPSR